MKSLKTRHERLKKDNKRRFKRMSNEEKQMLDRVLAEHRYDPSSVIAVMQAVQKTYRYLP